MSLTESILTNEELGLPEFLVRRTLPDEYVGKRFLDNEEVTILSFLDTNGRISSSKSLMEFMVLMTRIEKVCSFTEFVFGLALKCCIRWIIGFYV